MKTIRIAWVHKKVLSYLIRESERTYPYETGGVLMGYWAKPCQEVVLNGVIGPGPNAKHRRFRFEPDYEWQESAIASIYNGSGRYVTYLGDWHSHPKGNAKLSIMDHISLWRIGQFEDARISTPIMGILAGTKHRFKIWYQERINFFGLLPIPTIKCLTLRRYNDHQFFSL